MLTFDIARFFSIRSLGVNDPTLKRHLRILTIGKMIWRYDCSCCYGDSKTGIRQEPHPLKKCLIAYIHPSLRLVSFRWWLGQL